MAATVPTTMAVMVPTIMTTIGYYNYNDNYKEFAKKKRGSSALRKNVAKESGQNTESF